MMSICRLQRPQRHLLLFKYVHIPYSNPVDTDTESSVYSPSINHPLCSFSLFFSFLSSFLICFLLFYPTSTLPRRCFGSLSRPLV